MAGSSLKSVVCAICLGAVRDARLLNCLHSFCKRCIDDLDMRSGHEHKITCPVCREISRLPENRASGLPRDITVVVEVTSECITCSTEHGAKVKPEVSCTSCNLAFCKEHALPHAFATGHSIRPLPKNAASSSSRATTSSSDRLCADHSLPLRYFCKQCNVTVCGDCTVFGAHCKHQPIVPVKDIANDLKHRVSCKAGHLKKRRLPQAESSLAAVQNVSTQLSSNAESIRSKIRSSAKRVHETVDLVMEQKLAEIDDLEDLRLKHLNCQHDELKRHTDGLKSAIHFSEKVVGGDLETEGVCELLLAAEKRAEELDNERVAQIPVENARVDFGSVNEETLLVKISELVGNVIPCQASAAHTVVEGKTKLRSAEGYPVSFVVVVKDSVGRRLVTGGDIIRVESSGLYPDPCHDVVDNNDGTYRITITAEKDGDFDVLINGVKLQQRLSIRCVPFTFDSAECQAGNTISQDNLTVTHTGQGSGWSSVLGSRGMTTGQHVWKVKVNQIDNSAIKKFRPDNGNMEIFLGVAEKREPTTTRHSNYMLTYSWCGITGNRFIKGHQSSSYMNSWEEGDILCLRLNCTDHTLSITNTESGETDTIANLPPTTFFAYFATCFNSRSITLLP